MSVFNKLKNRQIIENAEDRGLSYLPQIPMDHNTLTEELPSEKKENPFSDGESNYSNYDANFAAKTERKLGKKLTAEAMQSEDSDSDSDDGEFGLEDIDRILDPEQYEKKKHKGDAKENLLMAKNSLEKYFEKNASKELPSKKDIALKNTSWLDMKGMEDDIDEDVALLNFIKSTQEKVRRLTEKANGHLGSPELGECSSQSTSPELEDSEEVVEVSSKTSHLISIYSPKQSISSAPHLPNSSSSISTNSYLSRGRKCWLDELASDELTKPKCPADAILADVEEFRTSPLTVEEEEEIERCSSPRKGKRKTLGWFRPNQRLMLARDSDPDLVCGEIEGPTVTKKDSFDDFWNS